MLTGGSCPGGGLDLRRRELLNLVLLAVLGEWRAYRSHLAGRTRTGMTERDVARMLDALEGVAGKACLRRARAETSRRFNT